MNSRASETAKADAGTREAFEKAWAARPWINKDESDKDRAFRWWCAALAGAGDNEPDPYGEAEQWGMRYALSLFAKQIAGVEAWEGGDGSESVDGDVLAEFHNIAKAAGWVNADGDAVFGRSITAVRRSEIARAADSITTMVISLRAEPRTLSDISDRVCAAILALDGGDPR